MRNQIGKAAMSFYSVINITVKKTLFIYFYILCWVLLFVLFPSCSSGKKEYTEKLITALSLAGENGEVLEEVLAYYSTVKPDSLKLRAAIFLIENMLGHYSYEDTAAIADYYNEIDSLTMHSVEWDKLYESVQHKYNNIPLAVKSDLKCMPAKYLIDNIERSFDLWEHCKWAQHIGFEDFCEYILPYKVTEFQTLDN